MPLGTAQKAPPVLADGKIYVGTDNGKFFIVRPRADRARDPERGRAAEQHEQLLRLGGHAGADSRPAPPISRGRVFFVSSDAVYAIGPRQATSRSTGFAVDEPRRAGQGAPAHVQVVADRAGAGARADGQAARAAVRRQGTVPARGDDGDVVARGAEGHGRPTARSRWRPTRSIRPALIKATVGALSGRRARASSRPLPWTEDVRVATRTAPCRRAGSTPPARPLSVTTLDGQKVLQKAPHRDDLQARPRRSSARPTWSNYTFEADVRAPTRRRQMGDIGITAQRYSLVLYGNSQQLKIEPWEPETARTVTVPFAWKPDTWYRLKLRVENLAERPGARARQGVAGRRARAGGVDDRQDRSDRQPRRARRVCSSTRSSARISTTSTLTQNQ